jgi:hypothetical protein
MVNPRRERSMSKGSTKIQDGYAIFDPVGNETMTIRRLLQYSSVPPEEMVRLRIAYQKTLKALDLVDRNDPISEIVA